MARLLILGSFHAGANCVQYAAALRDLGHEVVTCGPRFTQEDADRWRTGLLEMEWPPSPQGADEYVARVLRESPRPEIVTGKGDQIASASYVDQADAIVSFWQYGETPTVACEVRMPRAVVYGDTHTGHLGQMVYDARQYDHLFVQFRRADLASFDHPSKHWLPAAADPEIWKPYPGVERDIDVLFVGSTHPHVHKDRVALIEYLQSQGIDVTVKHAFGEDAARLMARAKVVLNKSLASDLNMRVPEALMCGATLVTDEVDGLAELCRDDGSWLASPFTTREAAHSHAGWFLRHPKNDTQLAAVRNHALATMTYEHRARELLRVMGLPEEGNGHGNGGIDSGADLRPVVDVSQRVDVAPHGEPMERPLVSIVIPSYKRADLTNACVEAVAMCRDYGIESEVLIVDDGSDYQTRMAYRTAPAIRVIQIGTNRGFAGACNEGALWAEGKYLVFLNNDCEVTEGWIRPLVDELERGASVVGPLLKFPDGRIQSAGLMKRQDGTWWNFGEEPTPEQGNEQEAVCGACLATPRELFLRLGGFDEGFKQGGCEDVDYCLRVRKDGGKVVLRPDSEVIHNEGQTRFQLPDVQERIRENQARLIERWGTNGTAVLDRPDRRSGNGDVPGDADPRLVGDGQAGERGTEPTPARPIVVVWQGPPSADWGGSLGVINEALRRRLRAHGIDPWHTASYPGGPSPIGMWPADGVRVWVSHYWPGLKAHEIPREQDVPWAVIQPWELGSPPAAWAKTWAHPAFRLLITPSTHSERLFLEAFPELQGKTKVIPNGVDTSLFSPEGEKWPMESQAYRFLFVGGPIFRKGVDQLYAAWSKAFLAEDAARLILKEQGGSTFYQGQVIDPPPGLPNLQRITKDLPTDQLAALYRSVDAYVCASRAEGFCLPALEAMASGLPVIAPRTPPFTEYLTDDYALLLDDVPRDLPRAMRYVFEHPDAGRAMGERGRAAALNYSWDRIAAQYAAEIRKVCE